MVTLDQREAGHPPARPDRLLTSGGVQESKGESDPWVVAIGSSVRIRSVGKAERCPALGWLKREDSLEHVIAIVAAGGAGLYRLTPWMPLGRALLGHRAGDVVRVTVEAGTVEFEVLAVEPAPR
jgi:Transcription elongation factor, GreA/GreB, C-term